MKSKINNLLGLFYPKNCLTCAKVLTKYEEILCFSCKIDLPLTKFSNIKDNETEKIFYGRVPIESATSLLHFSKKGNVQKLIHHLKYKNQQKIGILLGELMGEEILLSNRFDTVDCVIPVPLHPSKLKIRGYNQVTKFGQTLAQKLAVPYHEDLLIVKEFVKTQTRKNRFDRLNNLEKHFELANKGFPENKHILLIDDIVTTGATLEACCIQLGQTKNIKISIATMAITD
jgi:competence protein ComFC